MKKELDEALCKKYPLIFKDRHGDMKETAMCWGFDCGDGWYGLIDHLCQVLMYDYREAERAFLVHHKHLNDDQTKWKEWERKYYTKENYIQAREKFIEERANVPVAMQVKEKYGGLRFYCDLKNTTVERAERLQACIDYAESLSYHVCEHCGTMNDVRSYRMGWIRTLCKQHAIENYGEQEVNEYLQGIEEYKDAQKDDITADEAILRSV